MESFEGARLRGAGGVGSSDSFVTVEISGLSLFTHHGVTEAEQQTGQRLVFDITFDVEDCDATVTDRLEDTIDYAAVCQAVALVATERSYRTLERVCTAVADMLEERFGASGVVVRATKPEPPIPLPVEEVSVEVSPLTRALPRARARTSGTGSRNLRGGGRAARRAAGDRGRRRARRSTRPSRSARCSTSATSCNAVVRVETDARAARAARRLQGDRARAGPRRRAAARAAADRRRPAAAWGTRCSTSERLRLPHPEVSAAAASCSCRCWSSTRARAAGRHARAALAALPPGQRVERVGALIPSGIIAAVLLTIDVGNTQTHVGAFDGAELVEHWRFSTDRAVDRGRAGDRDPQPARRCAASGSTRSTARRSRRWSRGWCPSTATCSSATWSARR